MNRKYLSVIGSIVVFAAGAAAEEITLKETIRPEVIVRATYDSTGDIIWESATAGNRDFTRPTTRFDYMHSVGDVRPSLIGSESIDAVLLELVVVIDGAPTTVSKSSVSLYRTRQKTVDLEASQRGALTITTTPMGDGWVLVELHTPDTKFSVRRSTLTVEYTRPSESLVSSEN